MPRYCNIHVFRQCYSLVLAFLLLSFTAYVHGDNNALSDSEIRKQLIQESISSYSGNCPCPYNLARNGNRCETTSGTEEVENVGTLTGRKR